MKFHEITITNIKSLVGTYTLSFEDKFPDSNLFLIYGDNGSGKTTIFDCLCLVLFDQTPNLDGGYQSEEKNHSKAHVVNKTQTYACIQLKFSIKSTTNVGERRYYLVTWAISRSSSKLEKQLKNPFRSITEVDENFQPLQTLYQGNAVTPCKDAMSEVLLGLTYDDFIKSVLLPQGEWAQFLRQSSSNRTETLEKITDTEFFSDIADRITNKKATANDILKELKGQIQNIPSTDEYQRAKEENQGIKSKIDFYTKVIDLAGDWKKLDDRLKAIQDIKQNISMEEGKKEVEQKLLEEVKQSHITEQKNHQYIGEQLQNFYPIHEQLLQECSNIQEAYASVTSLNTNKNAIYEDISAKKSRLEKIIIPSQSQDALDKAEEHLKEQQYKLKEVGINIDEEESKVREKIRERDRSLESTSDMLVDIESELFKYQKFAIEERQYRQRFKDVLETLRQAEKEYDACENHLKQFESEEKLIESEIFATKLEKKNIALRKELESLKQKNLNNDSSSDVHCPVCGSTEHPYLDADTASQSQKDDEADYDKALQILQQKLSKQKTILSKEQVQFRKLRTTVIDTKSRLQTGESSIEKKKVDLENSLKKLEEGFNPLLSNSLSYEQIGIRLAPRQYELDTIAFFQKVPDNYDYIKTENRNKLMQSLRNVEVAKVLRNKIVAVQAQREYILQLEKSWDLAKDKVKREMQRFETVKKEKERQEKLREDILQLKKKYSEKEGLIKMLNGQLMVQFVEFVKMVDGMNNKFKASKIPSTYLKDWIDTAQQSKRFQTQKMQQVQNIFVKIDSDLSAQRTSSAKKIEDLEKQKKTRSTNIAKIMERIQKYQASTQEISQLEKENQELYRRVLEIRDSDAPLQMFQPDLTEEQCREIVCDYSTIHIEDRTELEREVMENSKTISTYEAGQENLKKYLVAEKNYKHWADLLSLVKGSQTKISFRDFVQAIQLEGLLKITNQQLATLSSPYRLTPVTNESGFPTLDFQVYSSDKIVRPLKTLSNGEEFIVALAMALALAKMRAVYMPIETLLIDEGFGSLDFQNVEMVVQALSSLQLQDIQVGLISHVQSLIENIDHKVRVDELLNITAHKSHKELPTTSSSFTKWVREHSASIGV